MIESSVPSRIETLSRLTSLKSGLIYDPSDELSIIAFRAEADSGATISSKERPVVLLEVGAAMTILASARARVGGKNMVYDLMIL